MEGYFLYVSDKLNEIRLGKPGSRWICEFSELKTWSFWKVLMAEFLATLLFVFLGLQSVIPLDGTPPLVTQVAFAFGLAIMAVIQIFENVSGACTNPAVTIAFAVVGKMTPVRTFFYLIAEFGGGLTAAFILKGVTAPAFHDNIGLNVINSQVSIGQAIGIEIIMTFVLAFVAIATTDPNRINGGNHAIAVGLTVAGLILTGDTYTGTSVNPARSFASAVASNNYTDIWVFFVGPIVGAVAGTLAYTFIFSPYQQWNYPNTKIPSVDEATYTLLHDDGAIVIPKEYFAKH